MQRNLLDTIPIFWPKNPQPGSVILRPYQQQAVDKIISDYQSGTSKRQLIILATSMGKCLERNTSVLMFDGTVRYVQEVVVGDQLMGPDSKPRNVLGTTVGRGKMFKIIPHKGNPWGCNDAHILSLKCTSDHSRKYKKDAIKNICITEYLKETKNFKHMMKQWRIGVEFKKTPVEYDPYIVGVWLGDGTRKRPQITNSDPEIVDYIKKWAASNNLKIKAIDRCNTTMFYFSNTKLKGKHYRNVLTKILNMCQITGEKRIPHEYKINSREIRLQVLAGLLDTDGCLLSDKRGFEVTFKDKGLAEDAVFIARSLGFSSYIHSKTGQIKSINFIGQYWRVTIFGDCHEIPCKVKRRQAEKRNADDKRGVLKTGFKIQENGIDDYFGFEIDGDHLFLLGDFTVTHNTATLGAIAQWSLKTIKKPVMLLAHREELLDQAAEEIAKVIGPDYLIEIEQADRQASLRAHVVLASVATIGRENSNRIKKFPRNHFSSLLCDEAHHSPSVTFQNVFNYFSPEKTGTLLVGCTATPNRMDEESLTGIFDSVAINMDIVKGTRQKFLTPIVSWRVNSKTDLSRVRTTAGDFNLKDLAILNNKERNTLVVDTWKQRFPDKQALIFAVDLDHVYQLVDEFQAIGVSAAGIDGTTPKEVRRQLIADFKSGILRILVNFGCLTEGLNIPRLELIIMARPTQSQLLLIQCIGRSNRLFEGKSVAHIVEIVDLHNSKTATVAKVFGFTKEFDCEGHDFLECVNLADSMISEKEQFNPYNCASWSDMKLRFEKSTKENPRGFANVENLIPGGKERAEKENIYSEFSQDLDWYDSRYRYYRSGQTLKLTHSDRDTSTRYQIAVVPNGLGGFDAIMAKKPSDAPKLYPAERVIAFRGVSGPDAVKKIEEFVVETFPEWDNLLRVNAPWKKRASLESASEKQLALIRKFRLSNLPDGQINKLEASNLIGAYFNRHG